MISPEDFAMMVSEDIKGKSNQITKDMLRDPSNQERWRDNLLEILKKVNVQIHDMKKEIVETDLRYENEGFEFDPSYSTKSKLEKAERFRFHTEKRLAEADRLIALGVSTEDMKLSSFLRACIEEHKRLKEEVNSHDDIDKNLWEGLKGKWSYG